jgi:hypothetical protein
MQNFYLKLFLIELKSIIVQHIIILSQGNFFNQNIFGIFTKKSIAKGQRLSVFFCYPTQILYLSLFLL